MLDIEQYLYRNMQAIFHDTTLSVEKHGYYFFGFKGIWSLSNQSIRTHNHWPHKLQERVKCFEISEKLCSLAMSYQGTDDSKKD